MHAFPLRRLLLPAALLLGGALLGGCGAGSGQDAPAAPTVAATRVAMEAGYRVVREYTGTVVAAEHDDIGFELAGTLRSMTVDEGDPVAAGAVLAELDTSLLAAERGQLQAQLAENAARARLVAANLQREQSLKRSGFAAEQRLDELRAEEQSLAAAGDSIRASLAANDARLAKSRLVAPWDGVVTRRYRDTGAAVVPGTPVLRLIESASREARVGVPARLAPQLATGAELEVVARGQPLRARVLALGADIDPVTRTLTARLALPAVPALADGELLSLRVPEEFAEQGTWLPFAAITEGLRGLWVVYALVPADDGNYRIEARDVEVLYAGEDRVFVRGALAEGELLVGTGLQRVAPGQTVRLAAATDA